MESLSDKRITGGGGVASPVIVKLEGSVEYNFEEGRWEKKLGFIGSVIAW